VEKLDTVLVLKEFTIQLTRINNKGNDFFKQPLGFRGTSD